MYATLTARGATFPTGDIGRSPLPLNNKQPRPVKVGAVCLSMNMLTGKILATAHPIPIEAAGMKPAARTGQGLRQPRPAYQSHPHDRTGVSQGGPLSKSKTPCACAKSRGRHSGLLRITQRTKPEGFSVLVTARENRTPVAFARHLLRCAKCLTTRPNSNSEVRRRYPPLASNQTACSCPATGQQLIASQELLPLRYVVWS